MLLRPDVLRPGAWRISAVPAIVRVLAVDLADSMVYATDRTGKLIGLDLQSQRARVYSTGARQLTGTPDGVVIGVDSVHRPLRFTNRSLTVFHAALESGPVSLLRGPGAQLVAISGRGSVAQVLGTNGEIRRFSFPTGDIAETWSGDLIAVTSDSGVRLIDPSGKRPPKPTLIRMKWKPTVSAFSPSGHRIYVARQHKDLVMLDRFSGEEMRSLPLPGIARALRVDRTGRWLLGRSSAGDSMWVVDLARWEVVATMAAPWADDLPLVTGGRTLVLRQGNDLLAYDISGTSPLESGRLAGAATDLYVSLAWSPTSPKAEPQPERVAAAADTTPPPAPAQKAEPAPGKVAAPPQPAAEGVYIQVSSSQNQDLAKQLAQQLHDGGYPAKVLDPRNPDDGYKVVIGPYATRDEADAAGKKLGRPYFIIVPGTGGT